MCSIRSSGDSGPLDQELPIAQEIRQTIQFATPISLLVTGDTHLGQRRDWLPTELTEEAKCADFIIHTGDFTSDQALSLFRSHGQLLAVSGNNEEPSVFGELPELLQIEAGQHSVIVTHGHRERGQSAKDAVQRNWAGEADLVVFGHSHQPCWEEANGTWFLNPGSPTVRRRAPRFSFARLEIDENDHFSVSFTYFDELIPPRAG